MLFKKSCLHLQKQKVKTEMYIDLNGLIKEYKLNHFTVCDALFPETDYPKAAYKRVLNFSQDLKSFQIYRLASISGLSISQIFNHAWSVCEYPKFKRKAYEKGGVIIVFENGTFARAFYKGVVCKPDTENLSLDEIYNKIKNEN